MKILKTEYDHHAICSKIASKFRGKISIKTVKEEFPGLYQMVAKYSVIEISINFINNLIKLDYERRCSRI